MAIYLFFLGSNDYHKILIKHQFDMVVNRSRRSQGKRIPMWRADPPSKAAPYHPLSRCSPLPPFSWQRKSGARFVLVARSDVPIIFQRQGLREGSGLLEPGVSPLRQTCRRTKRALDSRCDENDRVGRGPPARGVNHHPTCRLNSPMPYSTQTR